MKNDTNVISSPRNRRSFLKTGLAAAGAVGTGLLARGTTAYAQPPGLTAGDTAILQFLAAGEALEADFYSQYNELGGIQDSEQPGGSGNRFYTEKLKSTKDQSCEMQLRDLRAFCSARNLDPPLNTLMLANPVRRIPALS